VQKDDPGDVFSVKTLRDNIGLVLQLDFIRTFAPKNFDVGKIPEEADDPRNQSEKVDTGSRKGRKNEQHLQVFVLFFLVQNVYIFT
jgi:hypothetical protein